MFGFALTEMKQDAAARWNRVYRFCLGAAFVLMASASIQYEEQIAPSVERVSDAWSSAATDFSRRLSSFTL